MRPPEEPSAIARAQIRWAAVLASFYLWCAGNFVALCLGKHFPQAISNSSAGVLAALTGWAVYHAVSRRNDGLALLGMGMWAVMTKHDVPFLPAFGLSLLITLPCAWFFGMTARVRQSCLPAEDPTAPLYDAAMDGEAHPRFR